jgi:putative transposase
MKSIYERYVVRERSREGDLVNKLAKGLTRLFPNTIHVLEDLEKEELISRKKTPRSRRKRNARTPWELIQRKISEKAVVVRFLRKTPPARAHDAGM